MRAGVIIAAAGSGLRMKARKPKALLPLLGKPILQYCLETFSTLRFIKEIILVLPESWIARVEKQYGEILQSLRVTKLVPGGSRRQDSVSNGLRVIDASIDVVLIHDAARPFVSQDLIRRTARMADQKGAALAAVPARDTVKVVDRRGRVQKTPPRESIWLAQTPQAFRRELLVKAYAKAGQSPVTDDTQLVEKAGGTVVVVEGEASNFKVTTPDDMRLAKALLQK